MLAAGADRRTTVVALGGGVVGDLAGFAAAVALRGLPFVQVPTTLLAQVDSSVGGKTGINLSLGKNLVGAFHQPRIVLADMATLRTLPPRELRAGYGEVAKHGLLSGETLWRWCEAQGPALVAGDAAAQAHAVLESCRLKSAVVAGDEREESAEGGRALLNLGHTFGHALESESGYGGLVLHGEAVGVGLGLAAALSARLGQCSQELPGRVISHLEACGMPARIRDLPRRYSDRGADGADAQGQEGARRGAALRPAARPGRGLHRRRRAGGAGREPAAGRGGGGAGAAEIRRTAATRPRRSRLTPAPGNRVASRADSARAPA